MKSKYIGLAMAASLFLTACSKDDTVRTLSGDGQKTPIMFSASLSTGNVATRAYNDNFEANDKLVIGLRNSNAALTGFNSASLFAQTSFTVGANANSTTSSLSPTVYWDDFSSSDYDLKEGNADGNKLQALYGVCLNGGTATVAAEGTLAWSTQTDQAVSGTKTSDLLLAPTQTGVAYSRSGNTITVPFSHAMSKITINLIANDGYNNGALANTKIALENMIVSCDVDAKIKAPLSNLGLANQTVTMSPVADIGTKERQYSAVVVPGKTIQESSDAFAKITDADGNSYVILLTKAILTTAVDNKSTWAANLDNWNETAGTGTLKAGVNYILNVILNKQKISVSASIADWNSAAANAYGEIKFTADGTNQGSTTGTSFKKSFAVYYNTNTQGTAGNYVKGSTYTWDTANSKYTTAVPMYWESDLDNRFFRAAIYASANETTASDAVVATGAVTGISAVKGEDSKDLLWGTSGALMYKPTIADVKMTFTHALTKITVKLNTTSGADAVDLTKVQSVTVQGTKSSGGIMNLHDGAISLAEGTSASDLSLSVSDETPTATSNNRAAYLVIPQSIPSDAKIVVTMTDGSTYSANLENMHKNGGINQTTAVWEATHAYIYTLTLKKSAVSFTATLIDWVVTSGSGSANMDWD